MIIKIKRHTDIELPEKIKIGDWIDLRSAETLYFSSLDYKLISLGISVEIPKGYEANIVPRSSTFKNFGIIQANSFGVIDNSYCSDTDIWKFPAIALHATKINKGDRICQFRINKVMEPLEIIEVETLDNKPRNGLGSTGKN